MTLRYCALYPCRAACLILLAWRTRLIIYNYLARQLFVSTAGVAFVLSLILISGRFIKYMAEAASGRILGDVLFAIMAYRLPGFLELILPLSLFLGVLLAYGQLYMSNEITVLTAC